MCSLFTSYERVDREEGIRKRHYREQKSIHFRVNFFGANSFAHSLAEDLCYEFVSSEICIDHKIPGLNGIGHVTLHDFVIQLIPMLGV